jgi:hypothetical protein
MAKTSSASKTKRPKINFGKLQLWNRNLAALHLLQGVAILVLSTGKTFPVTTNFLGIDALATQAQGHPVLAGATRHLFEVQLSWLIAAFFFLSAIAHFLMSTYLRELYEKNLAKKLNAIRWFEYAFSASIMLVAIGLLSGVSDFSSLLMIFALCAVMNLLGLVMEVHNQNARQVNWLSYIVGCIASIVPWIVLMFYLIGSQIWGGGVPGFVYGIYASLFVLFGSFAVNMFLQYRKRGKWADYVYGEYVYMILSLVAKTALAWQIFAGSLRP